MDNQSTYTLFPIRELVIRTGVNASTLRAWENRHGLLKPVRTPSGHRLYSQNDVHRIRRLQELIAQGLSLNMAAEALDSAPTLTSSNPVKSTPSEQSSTNLLPPPAWQGYLNETLLALEDFSSERLDSLYNEACAIYTLDVVTENLLLPILVTLGGRWDKRVTGIAEEHFFSAWLRNKLGARLHHASGTAKGEQLILACLPHDLHEIGLLIFALAALQRGFRVVYLGANMPLRQLVHVARHTQAIAVVLVGRASQTPLPIIDDIQFLADQLAVPVFVGSHFSLQNHDALLTIGANPLGEHMVSGLTQLETRLRVLNGVSRKK
jgi:DNA-binding transcriptional MerR regulator/methylmalonyl-CoA mutase cobalamin-binding subunit